MNDIYAIINDGNLLSTKFFIDLEKERFEEKCRQALRKKIHEKMKGLSVKMRPQVIAIFKEELKGHETFKALCNPLDLGGDLGIDHVRANQLVNFVSRSISVVSKPITVTKPVLGGLAITLIKDDIDHFLNSPLAKYISENGYDVPWLEWLLTRGTDFIVETLDYFILDVQPRKHPSSRTGHKIMVKDIFQNFGVTKSSAISWEYAGTIDDNWFTQSAQRSIPRIKKIINQELLKRGL